MRALGSSKEETGTVRECSRAGQYRLSCTGQFSKFPAELRTCCRCSRKKLARRGNSRWCNNFGSYLGYKRRGGRVGSGTAFDRIRKSRPDD